MIDPSPPNQVANIRYCTNQFVEPRLLHKRQLLVATSYVRMDRQRTVGRVAALNGTLVTIKSWRWSQRRLSRKVTCQFYHN